MEELIALLRFAINNEDKFTECDPDLVKHQWIEAAKKAVEAAQQHGVQRTGLDVCGLDGGEHEWGKTRCEKCHQPRR